MVESGKSTPTEDLLCAVDRLLDDGADGARIAEMVAKRIATYPEVGSPTDIVDFLDHADDPGDEVMYEPGHLPDGLIDLPSASKKYGIPNTTLRTWVQRGKLPRRGRVRARAAGGGYIVVRKDDIKYCRDHPLKTGRKPKRETP